MELLLSQFNSFCMLVYSAITTLVDGVSLIPTRDWQIAYMIMWPFVVFGTISWFAGSFVSWWDSIRID